MPPSRYGGKRASFSRGHRRKGGLFDVSSVRPVVSSFAPVASSATAKILRPYNIILFVPDAFFTQIQPTWFLSRDWFVRLGGYMEAPPTPATTTTTATTTKTIVDVDLGSDLRSVKRAKLCTGAGGVDDGRGVYRLYHPSEIDPPPTMSATAGAGADDDDDDDDFGSTLRLAEDTRFFHAHLRAGGRLHLHRTPDPLLTYRHQSGLSQSSRTPRRLLLKLRVRAWEDAVFRDSRDGRQWANGFAVWGGESTFVLRHKDGRLYFYCHLLHAFRACFSMSH